MGYLVGHQNAVDNRVRNKLDHLCVLGLVVFPLSSRMWYFGNGADIPIFARLRPNGAKRLFFKPTWLFVAMGGKMTTGNSYDLYKMPMVSLIARLSLDGLGSFLTKLNFLPSNAIRACTQGYKVGGASLVKSSLPRIDRIPPAITVVCHGDNLRLLDNPRYRLQLTRYSVSNTVIENQRRN